ncbi:MAG: glycoside hydrolase family 9 protein, partial [Oscillospiraceae bacterium]|nr:glycoside hydrolase family 9 protein [Oscillospiraceae bacterium]
KTGGAKKAILVSDVKKFQICDAGSGQAVYTGKTSGGGYSRSGGEDALIADFSEFTAPGKYIIKNGKNESLPFEISGDPYAGLRKAVLDVIEAQSCGRAVDFGAWSHPECHTELATVYGTDIQLDVSGGWHDAGDYGRYIVPAAQTVADLLFAERLGKTSDPGLLDIVRWELEWMLKMQDDETGGVYHKVTTAIFCEMDVLPQDDTEPLIISPISTAATGDFAAVMAMADRSYRPIDPEFADEMLEAAQKAWDWLEENPSMVPAGNRKGIETGEYNDVETRDERFWAACELYAATGEKKYHDFIKQSEIYTGLGWADVGSFGCITYLFDNNGVSTDGGVAQKMREELLRQRFSLRVGGQIGSEPYLVAMPSYPWGSNMSVANGITTFLIADRIQEDASNLETSMDHLHYILGRNPLSQSYVSGFGVIRPKRPHHRPSIVAGAPMPGMLIGGPSQNLEDPYAKSLLSGRPPAKCFVDNDQSYSTNEMTIYWNSALYLALALLGV